VKPFLALLLLAAVPAEAAETVPLPRPRPAQMLPSLPPATTAPVTVAAEAAPACRGRLGRDLAIATALPQVDSEGCEVKDAVRLEAIVLKDKNLVAVTPPATLGCAMADAIVRWVRDDVADAAQELGSPVRGIDNYASFSCRSRNNIRGAQLSEHGRANALDIRSVRLADGRTVRLFDAEAERGFREGLRKSACARFSTVLGPGSDGYHEDHIHVDLMPRAVGRFPMCRWVIKDADPAVGASATAYAAPPSGTASPVGAIPLPRPRPKVGSEPADGTFDARWMPHECRLTTC
jgi:hypothetical protein